MSEKLFSSKVRAEAHAFLAKHLADDAMSPAECREDFNAAEPYAVWDGPELREAAPPTPPPAAPAGFVVRFTDEELEKIGAAAARTMQRG